MFDNYTGLIKFSAEWCQPCKVFAPVVAAVAEETGVAVRNVDIEAEPELAQQFDVRSLPTLIAMKNGEPVDVIVGSVAKERVIAMVNTIVS